jgi:AcrR family transcriptional regulator
MLNVWSSSLVVRPVPGRILGLLHSNQSVTSFREIMHQNGKPPAPASRDPDRTRRRILAAALAEFSTHGFAGARVDAIARRAKGNKRMLYHYFGNKEALFSAVLRHKMAERRSWGASLSNDPTDRLPFWFETACGDADWIRLLQWEALQVGTGKMIDESKRRAESANWLQRLRQRQKQGQLSPVFDPRHLALAMQSLTCFPAAFPQIVRLCTGKSVADPTFQKKYRKFLAEFAAVFLPANRKKRGR